MDTVAQTAPGCEISMPNGPASWKVHMLGFVDNKRHYINNTSFVSAKILIIAIERSVNSWNELLHFSGGALELSKCAWYILKWVFNNKDKPVFKKRDTLFIKKMESK